MVEVAFGARLSDPSVSWLLHHIAPPGQGDPWLPALRTGWAREAQRRKLLRWKVNSLLVAGPASNVRSQHT